MREVGSPSRKVRKSQWHSLVLRRPGEGPTPPWTTLSKTLAVIGVRRRSLGEEGYFQTEALGGLALPGSPHHEKPMATEARKPTWERSLHGKETQKMHAGR